MGAIDSPVFVQEDVDIDLGLFYLKDGAASETALHDFGRAAKRLRESDLVRDSTTNTLQILIEVQ